MFHDEIVPGEYCVASDLLIQLEPCVTCDCCVKRSDGRLISATIITASVRNSAKYKIELVVMRKEEAGVLSGNVQKGIPSARKLYPELLSG